MSCFFFKQKTAYEVRISDWSSDVCSSDLDVGHGPDAAEDDADHAADLRRGPGLPARGPGAVPGGQRRPGPAAAVADHQEVRRAADQAAGGEELIPHRPAARRALRIRRPRRGERKSFG